MLNNINEAISSRDNQLSSGVGFVADDLEAQVSSIVNSEEMEVLQKEFDPPSIVAQVVILGRQGGNEQSPQS